ncbi:MAG TPA: HD domain-containing protein [Opitutaceae bacterium]|nr:HD domain-containing protein [Opitutaceae bacterium]
MSAAPRKQLWREVVQRLQAMCLAFDPELAGHNERVGVAAAALARRLGLPKARVERIRIAAGLHDVGKVGIPRAVLHRSGRLGARELALVRTHPEIGHRILAGSGLPEIRCAAEVAYCHHEHWVGTGYPRGLKGTAIPLEARIVAIADVFDAMRSCRPYKEAWTDERVIAEMRRGRAVHFDPDVFDVFVAGAMPR